MGLGADGATDDDGGDEDIDVEERKDSTAGAGGVLLDEGKCMSALNEEGEEIMCTFCELTLTPGDHFVCEVRRKWNAADDISSIHYVRPSRL